VTDAKQLADFAGYLNANLAREIARLTGWTDKVWSRRVAEVVREIEEETAARRKRTGAILLGRAAVLKQDTLERPKKIKKSPAPLFHAASKRVRDDLRARPTWRSSPPSGRRRRSSAPEFSPSSSRREASLRPCPSWAADAGCPGRRDTATRQSRSVDLRPRRRRGSVPAQDVWRGLAPERRLPREHG
jgi:hypothetical protein